MEGLALLRILIQSTGLPKDAVERELSRVIAARGLKAEALTLEQVREVLAAYLQDVLVESKTQHQIDDLSFEKN